MPPDDPHTPAHPSPPPDPTLDPRFMAAMERVRAAERNAVAARAALHVAERAVDDAERDLLAVMRGRAT